MKAMLSIVCMLLSVVLLGVSGDTCLAYYDSLPSGANCGGAINCAYGLYCDPTSTCSPRLAPGATCTTIGPNECVYTATCKGPTGSLQCVSYASPGEPCSTSNTDTIPNCGSGLFCNPTTNKCVGGQFGDSCTADVDCATNLTCTSNVCTNVANGAFCTGDYQCGPGYACVSSSCTTQAAVGSKADCTKSSSICSFPDTCLYDPVANTTTCVSFNTVAADSYCGSNAYVCANDARCVEGLCAATNLDSQCEQDSDCPYDKACTCGGFGLYTGFGSCTGNPCISKYKDYFTCATTKCYNSLNFPPNYPKACVYTNCNATYNAVMQCASASSLSFSVFLVLLLAFFTSYLSF